MELISHDQASKLCGVKPCTLSNYIKCGITPPSVTGIRGSNISPPKYDKAHVLEMITAHRQAKADKKARQTERAFENNYRNERVNTAPKGYILANQLLNCALRANQI